MIDVFSESKITLSEVAETLAIDIQTVSKWRRDGLRCVRVGRNWITTREHVNEYVNQLHLDKQTASSTERINEILKL
tara:strand:- start:2609 stop:2839 length:231 start_codon:yes stop_codon:yes gene_type:complete